MRATETARQLLHDRLAHLVTRGHEAKDQLAAEMLLHGVSTTILHCHDALALEAQGFKAQAILHRIATEPMARVTREEVANLAHDHYCDEPDGNDFRYGIAVTTYVAIKELAQLLQGYLDRLDAALLAEGTEDSPWPCT